MLFICKDSLGLLFREFDSYFEELTLNLCKMIFKLIGADWRQENIGISIE